MKKFEYKIGRYKITLNLWLVIVFLLLQTLLNELGFWQLRRAQEKQQIEHQLQVSDDNVVSRISAITTSQNKFTRFSGTLYFFDKPVILVDNQVYQGALGYHLYQLAEDENGEQIWVARGWVAAARERNLLNDFKLLSGPMSVSGRAFEPSTLTLINSSDSIEKINGVLRVLAVDKPLIEYLNRQYKVNAAAKVLRLDNDPEGLVSHWQWFNMPADKHLAYAIQWFSLALALLIIGLIVATKKMKE